MCLLSVTLNALIIDKYYLDITCMCVCVFLAEQVRSMGNQIVPESRVVFLQHMRNTNTDTSVNSVNLRGFMDEVSAHRVYATL